MGLALFLVLAVFAIASAEIQVGDNVEPLEYEVKLSFDPTHILDANSVLKDTFTGSVTITATYKGGGSNIKLHSKKKYGLKFEKIITLKNISKNEKHEISINSITYDKENDIFFIPAIGLTRDDKFELLMNYEGEATEKNGYYMWQKSSKRFNLPHLFLVFQRSGWQNSFQKYMIATNSERQNAFPCFDEPSLKASVKLQLSVIYNDYASLGSKIRGQGPTVRTFTNDHSNKKSTWPAQDAAKEERVDKDATNKKIKAKVSDKELVDSYFMQNISPSQVSIAITNKVYYERLVRLSPEVTIMMWYCNLKRDYFHPAAERHYVELLRQNYQYPFNTRLHLLDKSVFLIVPGDRPTFSFKPGLALISDGEVNDPSLEHRKRNVFLRLNTILYGGLILPESWESQWLLSALTKYCTYQLQLGETRERLLMMEPPKTYPDIYFEDATDNFYDKIIDTNKGLMLFDMIHSIIGGETFSAVLNRFIEKFEKNGPVRPEDFWSVLDNNHKNIMMRFKYDKKVCQTILEGLRDGTTTANERARLVHDALSVAWSGYQDYEVAFNLINLMKSEKEIIVWNSFASGASNLNEILKFSKDTYQLFQTFIKTLMSREFEERYRPREAGEEESEGPFKRIREDVDPNEAFPDDGEDDLFIHWACTVARIEACTTAAVKMYDNWSDMKHRITSKNNPLFNYFIHLYRTSSLVYTMLCTVLANVHKDDKESMKRFYDFERVITNAYTALYRHGQVRYIEAFQCVTDVEAIDSLYEWIAKPEVKQHDTNRRYKAEVLLALAKGPHTYPRTLQFFYDNIVQLLSKYQETQEQMANIVRAFTSKMNLDQIRQMESFIKRNPKGSIRVNGDDQEVKLNTEKVRKAFEDGRATATARAHWMKANEHFIKELLLTVLNQKP